VGLSQAAVRQRVQRLIERGVMQVVAVTDPLTLGLRGAGDDRRRGRRRPPGLVGRRLADVSTRSSYVVVTAGRFDLLVEVVCARHRGTCSLLVNDVMRTTPASAATETFTYLDLEKQTYAWGTR
jgi:Lrp/AsnC family transcriptional regulator, regulator for asnA, asnC and gidA